MKIKTIVSVMSMAICSTDVCANNIQFKKIVDNVGFRIGLKCSKENSSIQIIQNIYNSGSNSIFFYPSQLSLEKELKNVYSFIPIDKVKLKDNWRYEIRYNGIQDVIIADNKKSEISLYTLVSLDEVYIKDFISDYYHIDPFASYRVETFISFMSENKNLISAAVEFYYTPACFDYSGIKWVEVNILTVDSVIKMETGGVKTIRLKERKETK